MKQDKKTYCWICNGRTGFGFGIEPMRIDTICCSSKCAKIINNPVEAIKYGITYKENDYVNSKI